MNMSQLLAFIEKHKQTMEHSAGKEKDATKPAFLRFPHDVHVCFPRNSCKMLDRASILFSRKRSKAKDHIVHAFLGFHQCYAGILKALDQGHSHKKPVASNPGRLDCEPNTLPLSHAESLIH